MMLRPVMIPREVLGNTGAGMISRRKANGHTPVVLSKMW